MNNTNNLLIASSTFLVALTNITNILNIFILCLSIVSIILNIYDTFKKTKKINVSELEDFNKKLSEYIEKNKND